MYRLAIIGFGVVGQGFAEIVLKQKERLAKEHGFECEIVAVSDFHKGSAYDPKGLDIAKLLELAATNAISSYPGAVTGMDALETIKRSNADIVVEVSYTNIKTGEPAYSHFKAALERGKHLVTTNKGPTALFFKEVKALAQSRGLQFRYEGSVMSGTPVLNLSEFCLAGNDVKEMRGILNGTTNFILSNMEKGKTYAEALKEAQQLGFAEAVPDADVEGYDAMAKVIILAKAVMGADIDVAHVDRIGITNITLDDINTARVEGKRWKLIGRVAREGGSVRASVRPERLELSDPLAGVMGATNAATFRTELLGSVTIIGPGAGKTETGFSVLIDLLDIHKILSAEKRGAAHVKAAPKSAPAKKAARPAPKKARPAKKVAKRAPKRAPKKLAKRVKKTAGRMKRTARRR